MDVTNIFKLAKKSAEEIINLDTNIKNSVLDNIVRLLEEQKEDVFLANEKDLELAKELVKSGEITESVYNRLKLDENKMRDMIQGVKDIKSLDDPIGKVLLERELDTGILLKKVSTPIGVLGVIFEARPDVITQISALAIKSSNAVVLKGGKEAINTNKAIFEIIKNAITQTNGFPENVISQIYTREDVALMLKADEYIDLIIPRGGNSLVKFIKENTKIPVLGHADGVCHIYIDEFADIDMVKNIVVDAKTQYPSACNSVETLLVNKNFKFEKELREELEKNGIEVITNPQTWRKEYSDKILSYKYVDDVESAVKHINEFGSHHTDCIITEKKEVADLFLSKVDSSGVYWNISTRFADGFRYGFGAEVGISTNKIHARGPVGLEGLTTYKYQLIGCGDIVKPYAKGEKVFHHKNIKG